MERTVAADDDEVAALLRQIVREQGGLPRLFRFKHAHFLLALFEARQRPCKQLFLFPFPRTGIEDNVDHCRPL